MSVKRPQGTLIPAPKFDVIGPSKFDTHIDRALRALVLAETPAELAGIASVAEGLRIFARRAKLGLAAQNRAADIRVRCERRIGELLVQTQRHIGGRPRSKPVPEENGFSPMRLRELGIDRKLSAHAQRLADIPTRLFETFLAEAHRNEWEITTRALSRVCAQQQAATENRRRVVGGRIADLVEVRTCRKSHGHDSARSALDTPRCNSPLLSYYTQRTTKSANPRACCRTLPFAHVDHGERHHV
jgi:hypothetical protein